MTIGESTQRKSIEKIDAEKAIGVVTPSYIDGGYGWMIVFASFGIQFVHLGVLCSLGVIYSQILKEFNEGSAYTSLILSLLSTSTAIMSPLTSYLVGIYGFRSVTISGALLATISLLASYYAQNVLSLIITIGIGYGSGMGMMFLPAAVCYLAFFDKYRSTAAGIISAGGAVGTFICTPVAAYLNQEYGWRLTLVYLSAIVSICVVFGSFLRPIVSTTTENDSREKNLSCAESRPKETIESTALDLFKNPIVMLMATSSFFGCIGYFVPYFCLSALAVEKGMKIFESSHLISILGLANMFGRIFWGLVSDKLFVDRLWIYVSSLIISGAATIACVLSTNFMALAVYATIFGFIVSASVSQQTVVLSDLVGVNEVKNAYGLILLFEGFGSFIGPLEVGFFHDLNNSYLHGFIFGGVFIILSGLLIFFVPILRNRAAKSNQICKQNK